MALRLGDVELVQNGKDVEVWEGDDHLFDFEGEGDRVPDLAAAALRGWNAGYSAGERWGELRLQMNLMTLLGVPHA